MLPNWYQRSVKSMPWPRPWSPVQGLHEFQLAVDTPALSSPFFVIYGMSFSKLDSLLNGGAWEGRGRMILILSKYKSLQKSLLQTWREGLQACSDTEPGLSHQQKALAWGGARPSRDRNTHHFLGVTPERVAGRQWHN